MKIKTRRKFIHHFLLGMVGTAYPGDFILPTRDLSSNSTGSYHILIDGKIYGAKANDQGPIGGGKGYRRMITTGDHIVTSLDELIAGLQDARRGDTIYIPGETVIDLTTYAYIDNLVLHIPDGVILAGSRGLKGSKGPLIFNQALKSKTMMIAEGPDVRITGLRIQGPNSRRYLEHHAKAFGPGGKRHEYYYKFPTNTGIFTSYANLEIDNCDISGFSHRAIFFSTGKGHHVHHNFIHHCQYNGLGYGVGHDKSSSLIEYNYFDHNRHSIAGTGNPGCSYIARNNVELGTSLSHCFDMHGGKDRKDGSEIAGTNLEIRNNTFRADTAAIGVRGEPEDKCDISRNWFASHMELKQAVTDYGYGNINVVDNVYGPHPTRAK